MSMYEIMRGTCGKYHCTGRLQDGTERWSEDSLDAAVKSLKRFARVMNGTKIKRSQIDYYENRMVDTPRVMTVKLPIPPKQSS